MTDQHYPAHAAHVAHDHGDHGADARFRAYIKVFVLLCVFTAVSFVCNYLVQLGVLGHMTSAVIIMLVAIVKATCVAYIFMHLNHDWRTVYCIMVPVVIMCVMFIIVLLPDGVLGWPHAEALPK